MDSFDLKVFSFALHYTMEGQTPCTPRGTASAQLRSQLKSAATFKLTFLVVSTTMACFRVAISALLFSSIAAFRSSCNAAARHATIRSQESRMQAGKGFGAPQPPPPPPPKRKPEEPPASASTPTASTPLNGGQATLADLRRERAERRDAELRQLREVRTVDSQLREDPSSGAIPEQVAMRMGKRMLPFVGIPLIGGMGAFVAFWYLATYKNQEFQPALVAFTTIGMLGFGLLGITYSVMSASWDPDREGSFLGFDEAARNLESLRGGLKRTRENAITRERMAGMSDAEMDAAIRDLNQREKKMAKQNTVETTE